MNSRTAAKIHARKLVWTPVCLLFWLGGCITHSDATKRFAYACPDGYQFTVEYSGSGGSLRFVDAERELKLDQVEAASGARYSDGNFVFWARGLNALIQENGETLHRDCTGDNI